MTKWGPRQHLLAHHSRRPPAILKTNCLTWHIEQLMLPRLWPSQVITELWPAPWTPRDKSKIGAANLILTKCETALLTHSTSSSSSEDLEPAEDKISTFTIEPAKIHYLAFLQGCIRVYKAATRARLNWTKISPQQPHRISNRWKRWEFLEAWRLLD